MPDPSVTAGQLHQQHLRLDSIPFLRHFCPVCRFNRVICSTGFQHLVSFLRHILLTAEFIGVFVNLGAVRTCWTSSEFNCVCYVQLTSQLVRPFGTSSGGNLLIIKSNMVYYLGFEKNMNVYIVTATRYYTTYTHLKRQRLYTIVTSYYRVYSRESKPWNIPLTVCSGQDWRQYRESHLDKSTVSNSGAVTGSPALTMKPTT